MSISQRLRSGSVKALAEELAKCVVLCANCHRNVHAGEIKLSYRNTVRKRKVLVKLDL